MRWIFQIRNVQLVYLASEIGWSFASTTRVDLVPSKILNPFSRKNEFSGLRTYTTALLTQRDPLEFRCFTDFIHSSSLVHQFKLCVFDSPCLFYFRFFKNFRKIVAVGKYFSCAASEEFNTSPEQYLR